MPTLPRDAAQGAIVTTFSVAAVTLTLIQIPDSLLLLRDREYAEELLSGLRCGASIRQLLGNVFRRRVGIRVRPVVAPLVGIWPEPGGIALRVVDPVGGWLVGEIDIRSACAGAAKTGAGDARRNSFMTSLSHWAHGVVVNTVDGDPARNGVAVTLRYPHAGRALHDRVEED